MKDDVHHKMVPRKAISHWFYLMARYNPDERLLENHNEHLRKVDHHNEHLRKKSEQKYNYDPEFFIPPQDAVSISCGNQICLIRKAYAN